MRYARRMWPKLYPVMFVAHAMISLFVLQPVVEYALHRFLHTTCERWHMQHHQKFTHGVYWSYSSHKFMCIVILTLCCFRWYILACMLMKYEIAHLASHRLPWLRHWHRHHFLHHRMPNVNFGFSAMWPDRIFGTLSS